MNECGVVRSEFSGLVREIVVDGGSINVVSWGFLSFFFRKKKK